MTQPMEVNAGNARNTAAMDVDVCDSCECIIDKQKIRQMNTGLCWFVALIHVISLSDSFKKLTPLKRRVTNVREAEQYLASLSGRSCAPVGSPESYIFGMREYCKNLKSFGEEKDILHEYFSSSDNPDEFCPATPYSGGVSFYYIMPFLTHLGLENYRTAKHVLCNFSHIRNLYHDPNYNPRQIKYTRVYADYMKWLLSGQVRPPFKEETNILVVTFIQRDTNIDILENRRLFLGKYIIFINNSTLYVYKLDAMLMSSFNNSNRPGKTGHMIACITCKDQGYIINSYDSQDESHVNCGHLGYDWYKWKNKNEIFSHKIIGTVCGTGNILTFDRTMKNVDVKSNQEDFYYHRDIGDNSFFYIKIGEYPITPAHNAYQINSPYQTIFDDYIYPYFYYFKIDHPSYVIQPIDITITKIIVGIIQSPSKSAYNLQILQSGVGIEKINNDTWGCFYLELSVNDPNKENIINNLVDILPDDMVVCSMNYINNITFKSGYEYIFIFVQYTTRQDLKYQGGRKTKPKRR